MGTTKYNEKAVAWAEKAIHICLMHLGDLGKVHICLVHLGDLGVVSCISSAAATATKQV